jgi:ribonucleoside-diphosphate reductase alpha chain
VAKKHGFPVEFNENARLVLEKRYLLRDDCGEISETPEALLERVAQAVASPEGRSRAKWAARFFELMASRRFLPNSPTLMNAGKKGGQLSACFVLPVDDSLDGIFETLKSAAKIHQSGGGTGFAFSKVRPEGSIVGSSHGTASGPVSFIRIFDVATETIKQGGTRRGANMAILRVDHPDIIQFINSKRDQRSALNFNISVGITADFMRAVDSDADFWLKDPNDGREVKKIKARSIFREMTQAAWECGDPGMVFLDRINLFNPTPQEGDMESTNPCGEQPLLPYESCNLGSLNLGRYVVDRKFDWTGFRRDVRDCVRFLDNIVDNNSYPVEECAKITRRNRKIGLGVMGFADLLLLLEVPYDSSHGVELGERIMSVLDREAKSASAELARSRGAFPNWKGSRWERLGFAPMRNATVSTVAPTGTISIIAGASGGIEPIFSGVFYRNVLSGERLVDIHPAVELALKSQGKAPGDWKALNDEVLTRELGPAWAPAHAVSVEWHIRMQAAFQRHSDSSVSKTINLPQSASREDIERAYLMAYASGCKGTTVYRDKSRETQVLEKPDFSAEAPEPPQACPSC